MAQILTLFKNSAFDDAATRAMGAAYDQACDQIAISSDIHGVREAVAKRILARASLGHLDPDQLREEGIAAGTNLRRSA